MASTAIGVGCVPSIAARPRAVPPAAGVRRPSRFRVSPIASAEQSPAARPSPACGQLLTGRPARHNR
jgi:hypothetical protein